MRKVKPFESDAHLSEIYSTGFQLSFVSPNLEQCHEWVLCKDFLTDAVWAHVNIQSAAIYGFRYTPTENPPLDMDKIQLIVRNKEVTNEIFDKQIEFAGKFLNIIETKLHFDLTTVEKVSFTGSGSVWLITGDKRWMHAPPMLSMYSLMIRIGCFYNGKGGIVAALRRFKKIAEAKKNGEKFADEDYDDSEEPMRNDAQYLKQSFLFRQLILQKGISIFHADMAKNYPSHADVHTMHNDSGIVGGRKCSTFKTLWDLSGLEAIKAKEKEKKEKKLTKDEKLTHLKKVND